MAGTAPSRARCRTSASGESLAPAVTRAAAILDVLAENAGRPLGPSELARRLGLPKSSIANICVALADAGLVRRIGTGFALGRQARRARRRVPRLGRPGPGVLRRGPAAAGRLGGDRPARGPRRARDDLPRPPRRPPAGPAHLADRPAAAGDRAPRPARPPWRRSTTRARRRLAGVTTLPAVTPQSHRGRWRRCAPTSTRSGERGYAIDDEETDGGRRLLRDRDPRPAARRGPVRGEHHAAQGPGDRRAGPAPDRRTCTGWRTSCPIRSGASTAGTTPADRVSDARR